MRTVALFFAIALFRLPLAGQTNTFAALGANNAFTGTNSFTGESDFNGILVVNGGAAAIVTNDTGNGTQLNRLVKIGFNASGATAVTGGTSDTTNLAGVCAAGCGTSGQALIVFASLSQCIFDGAAVPGDYFTTSTVTAGQCHDIGAAPSSANQIMGQVMSLASGTTYNVFMQVTRGGSGGGGSCSNCANQSLNNLTAPLAINAALLPQTAGNLGIGSTALPWQNLILGPGANSTVTLNPVGGSNVTLTIPNNTGTLAETNIANQTYTGLQIFSSGLNFSVATSTAANAATGGTINLAPGDSIKIKSNGGLVNSNLLSINGSNQAVIGFTGGVLIQGAAQIQGNIIIDGSGTFTLANASQSFTFTGLTGNPAPGFTVNLGAATAASNANGGAIALNAGAGDGTGKGGGVAVDPGAGGATGQPGYFSIKRSGIAFNPNPNLANDSVTPPIQNGLVGVSSLNPATIVSLPAASNSGFAGVCVQSCVAGPGTFPVIVQAGLVPVQFDGVATSGHLVGISPSSNGNATDVGTNPSSGEVLGMIASGTALGFGSNVYWVLLNPGGILPSVLAGNQIINNPPSSQTILGTAPTVTGLKVKQPSSGSVDIFDVLKSDGTNFFNIDKNGSANVGGTSTPGTVGDWVNNEGTTGTTVGLLAKITGAPGTAIKATTGDTNVPVFIVTAESTGAGSATTGQANLADVGQPSCLFDNAVTSGHYVGASSVTAGNCRDLGASVPTNTWVIGQVMATGAASTYNVRLLPAGVFGTTGGTSVLTNPGGSQTVVQGAGTQLNVNRFENAKFSADFGSVAAAAADCSGPCVVYVNASDSECNSTIPANVTLIGYGVSATTISCATANQPVFNVTGGGVEIYDMTIKHITNSPIAGGDGIITCGGCDRIKIQNVRTSFNWNGLNLGYLTYGEVNFLISERNNNDGVLITTDGVAAHQPQWEFRGGLVEQNIGNGVEYTNSAAVQTTCPHFSGYMTTFGNQGYGILIQATGGGGVADCLIDGYLASQNNNSGIKIDPGTSGSRNIMISNVYAEQAGTYTGTQGFPNCPGTCAAVTNTGYGIELLNGTNDSAPNLSNITTWFNSFSGILVQSTGTTMSNIQCFKNGVALSGSQFQRACVAIRATNVSLNGMYAKDSGSNMVNGIEISNSADTPSLSNYVCDSSVATCLRITTTPANFFKLRVNSITDYSGTGVPAFTCNQGDVFHRTDGATTGLYICQNSVWVAK